MTRGAMASILKRLHRAKHFESADEWESFNQKLQGLLQKGLIETVPVGMPYDEVSIEIWYRDKKQGDVWRLIPPDFPGRGLWEKVEDPNLRSFFRELWPDKTIDSEQYRALHTKLDQAVAKGEVERAIKIKAAGEELYFHRPTREVFELVPPHDDRSGWWEKVFPPAGQPEGTPWYGVNAKPS